MKINHIGKIASILLSVMTLNACTTYTGYSSTGYSTGYSSAYNNGNGYYNNGYSYTDYSPPVFSPPAMTVVQPSVLEVVRQPVIIDRPAPVIIREENRYRGYYHRPEQRNRYHRYFPDPRHPVGQRPEGDGQMGRPSYHPSLPNNLGKTPTTNAPQGSNPPTRPIRPASRDRHHWYYSSHPTPAVTPTSPK